MEELEEGSKLLMITSTMSRVSTSTNTAFVSSGPLKGMTNARPLLSCLEERGTFRQPTTLRSDRQKASMHTVMAADGGYLSLPLVTVTQTETKIRPRTERCFSVPYDDLVIRAWQPNDRKACVELIGSSLAEYGLEWDPRTADKDVIEVERSYHDGEFWVIEDVQTSEIVGTAAFYEVPQRGIGAIEIRKMYLSKKARGRGLGSFLLAALEERARQLGYSKAYIETASVLKEACALYKAKGYVPSRALETERCDIVLEKELMPVRPSADVQPVEAIDMTRGWTVTCCTRKQATEHRILYRAVVILVENNGRIFVHKRSMKKSTYPGRMATFVTGCVDWMEDPLQSAHREVAEELGISGLEFAEPFAPFISKGADGLGQRIMFHPFIATGSLDEEDVVCDPDEVECGEFMTREEIIERGIGGSLWKEFRAHGL